jgi:NAD(P)H-nitrite reductase large subunit
MKYLIIGNGAAGMAAVEKIRELDETGEIIMLSAEKYAVYSKCLLADFLSGQIPEDRMFIRDADFYEKNNIRICFDQKVVNIDFKLKLVFAENSENISEIHGYDKLLIASGSRQIVLPIKGLEGVEPHYLSTLAEAKRMMTDAEEAKRIIIIGAGFVGLEIAFNLNKKGKEMTIVEKAPRILFGQLDERASHIIRDFAEEEGIRIILESNITEVTSSREVLLDDGRSFQADMIIVSAGSRPNLGFITDPALIVKKGIIVDNYMKTSVDDVYAAGDVVETIDAITGERSLSPIWPNAIMQGETAGVNMTGEVQPFDHLIGMRNASEFREIPMIAMGITSPRKTECETYLDYRPVDLVYRKILVKDDVIIGMIFLGDIKNAGVIGALMKQKVNISKHKHNILNPNFGYSEVSLLLPV